MFLVAGILAGCSSSDDNPPPPIPDVTVDLRGNITDINDQPIAGAMVNVYLTLNDSSAEDTATTNASGSYMVTVIENASVYFEVQASGYATVNSEIVSFATNQTGLNISIPTIAEAEAIIDAAFGGMALNLADKAWLAINVYNAGGDEQNGVTVSVTPIAAGGGAANCDGTLTGGNVTSAPPCNPARDGVMYLAYYDANTTVDISVSDDSASAPVRMGEVTFVELVVP